METVERGQESDLVTLEVRAPVAVLRLGHPSERAVVLSVQRMESLLDAVKAVAARRDITGLVIVGSSTQMFCAGADINVIRSVRDPKQAQEFAKKGQDIFSAIEKLSCTTVAAISGPCVGGGCELALACNYRILLDVPATKIGLPEVRLGILPGFGGTQRLPRIVGIRNALGVILKGKVMGASEALKIGLADTLVRPSVNGSASAEESLLQLEEIAVQIVKGERKIEKRSLGFLENFLTYNALGRTAVCSQAKKRVIAETKGKYPAPLKAIESIAFGLANGTERGYQFEAELVGGLVATPESKALVNLYILSESASKLGRAARHEVTGKTVAVIGGGTMGAGIAASCIGSGLKVVLIEPIEDVRKRARERVVTSLEKRRSMPEAKKGELLKNLNIVSDMSEIEAVGFIIEAVIEDLSIKKKIFEDVQKRVNEETIIASNTSSLSISELAESVKLPERVVGIHFFNPPEKMPLVEIVRGKKTGEAAIVFAAALTAALGKYPVVVEDVAGFLVNRILTPYLVEAAHLLGEGITIAEIDTAATEFGMPMGPLRLLDEIGLDVAAKVANIIERSYGSRMEGPKYAAELVSKGRLGRKSGKGFYSYQGKDVHIDGDVRTLLGLPDKPKVVGGLARETVQRRLILRMVNEAVLTLDEGVAGQPGGEAAGQIDLATVMGIGFPPFRGGLMHYADSLGVVNVHSQLKEFEKTCGERFSPAPGIVMRASKNKSISGN